MGKIKGGIEAQRDLAVLTFVATFYLCGMVTFAQRNAEMTNPSTSKLNAEGYYALVIGNKNYEYVNKLNNTINDAKDLETILREQYGFHTQLLTDVNRVQILTALVNYRKLPEISYLLIYYAGHGSHDHDTGEAYWLPIDANPETFVNWISADDITSYIKAIPSAHILIVSDSCYSGYVVAAWDGSVGITRAERNALLAKMLGATSRTLMTSGGDDPVADDGAPGHSIFAAAVLDGLKSIGEDQFTAAELFYKYVQPEVGGRAQQLPQYNWIRNSSHNNGDFVFSRLPIANAHARQNNGGIYGQAIDPVGLTISQARISLSTDGGKTASYTFQTNSTGDYKGDGIAPGSYTATLRVLDTPTDKIVDQLFDIQIVAGKDTPLVFDLERSDYLAKLTPGQRNAAEQVRAKIAAAIREGSVIVNLNTNLTKARADNKAKNFTEAKSLMTEATRLKPDDAVIWLELGVAQAGEKQYGAAAASLKNTIAIDAASNTPNEAVQGEAGNALGEVLANEGNFVDSQAAYDAAAKVNPTSAALYYSNEAIVVSRSGNDPDATVAAANKAIAADPSMPIPFYLKGKALIRRATVDPTTKKIIVPPGCAEAYRKYLELSPNGQFAPEVQSILAQVGDAQP